MRQRLLFPAVILLTVSLTLYAREAVKGPAATEAGISVYFSPDGGCTDAIVAKLNAAKKTVDVQAYSFTNTAIAKALVAANKRGVRVRVVLDKSNDTDKYTSATFLANEGVSVQIDRGHEDGIAHSKVMIIDGQTIITGSFNFTQAAEKRNVENLLIIEGKPRLVAAYRQNFEQHLEHAQPYQRQ
jgi:phosphatidylserine/phosphatidylglycerophosphate/cardiolipin synthase-like enzyme